MLLTKSLFRNVERELLLMRLLLLLLLLLLMMNLLCLLLLAMLSVLSKHCSILESAYSLGESLGLKGSLELGKFWLIQFLLDYVWALILNLRRKKLLPGR